MAVTLTLSNDADACLDVPDSTTLGPRRSALAMATSAGIRLHDDRRFV
jgi:hypothetical protein